MNRDALDYALIQIIRRKQEEQRPKISYGEHVPLSKKPKGKKRLLIPIQYYNIFMER